MTKLLSSFTFVFSLIGVMLIIIASIQGFSISDPTPFGYAVLLLCSLSIIYQVFCVEDYSEPKLAPIKRNVDYMMEQNDADIFFEGINRDSSIGWSDLIIEYGCKEADRL